MELTQADKLLALKALERQLWDVVMQPKLTLAVGGALYIVWSDEDKAGKKNKPHPFQGDLRIVRKERTEKKNTIFLLKDGTTRVCTPTKVKNMVVTSNQVLGSDKSAIVFAKKLAHAEEPSVQDSDHSEEDIMEGTSSESDNSEEDTSDEDGEEDVAPEDTTSNMKGITTTDVGTTEAPTLFAATSTTTHAPSEEAGTQLAATSTSTLACDGTSTTTAETDDAGTQLADTNNTDLCANGTTSSNAGTNEAGTQLGTGSLPPPLPTSTETAMSPPTVSLSNPFAFGATASQSDKSLQNIPPPPTSDLATLPILRG